MSSLECVAAQSPKLKPILRHNNKSALHSAKTAQNRSKGYLSQTELRTDVMANMSTRRRATEKRSEVERSGVEDISFIPGDGDVDGGGAECRHVSLYIAPGGKISFIFTACVNPTDRPPSDSETKTRLPRRDFNRKRRRRLGAVLSIVYFSRPRPAAAIYGPDSRSVRPTGQAG